MKTAIAMALATLLLAGCASGFDRRVLRQELASRPYQVLDSEVRRAMAVRPQLRAPMRIAVYMVTDGDWRWSVEDKRRVESWAASLKRRGMVRDIFVMPDMIVRGPDVRSVRVAAARCGADAVLLVQGAAQVDEYYNPLVLGNLLILPMWILPSAHRDALVMMQGTMYDVGNECIYLAMESEGEGSICRPEAFAENVKAINKGKEKALEGFGRQFEERLASLCWDLHASPTAFRPEPRPSPIAVEPVPFSPVRGRRYETRD